MLRTCAKKQNQENQEQYAQQQAAAIGLRGRRNPGGSAGRVDHAHAVGSTATSPAPNGANVRVGFHSSPSRRLHSLSNRASGWPSRSSTSFAFEGKVAAAIAAGSPITRRARPYGSVVKMVLTLYSDSNRYLTTSNCNWPTAARIGSVCVCP